MNSGDLLSEIKKKHFPNFKFVKISIPTLSVFFPELPQSTKDQKPRQFSSFFNLIYFCVLPPETHVSSSSLDSYGGFSILREPDVNHSFREDIAV